MSGSNLKRAVLPKWYAFAVWAVAAVIFWTWVYGMVTRPEAEETLSVFICSKTCDSAETLANLQSVRPDYVKRLDFKWVSPDDSMFAVYYDAFAVDGGDIIVMPESRLNEYSYVDFFELDVGKVEASFGRTFGYYVLGDVAYGIILDGDCAGAQSFWDGEETYILFFNKNSLHVGEWTGGTRSGAIELARALL